ncbi:MAG TPA: C45 family autoproteolytic acyltransferase/hydrolase [Abditibacteriaceae bacterium]|nr:C45 family autoproteolytic acyltransferase/hydrolase [Abditibacteriaceae bacterium]
MGQAVFLVGEAAEVGALQGALQRAVLSERIGRTLRRAAEAGTTQQLHERADRFGAVLSQAAPHWLDEGRALAGAAGIELIHLLALNCLPHAFWGESYVPAPLSAAGNLEEIVSAFEAQGYEPLLGGDCTTFFALGEATLAGETLFHKNRDERDEVQCLYIKQIEGCNRFVGGGDIGHLGTSHLHTEDFWVGANNTGSAVPREEYEDCALNDGHVLRYLAERCESLDGIVPAIEELISNRWLGGGGANMGMILLFADAKRGLIVEATSRRLAWEWFAGDALAVRTNHFLLPEMQAIALPPNPGSVHRYERASELWQQQHGFAAIPVCGEIGRDRAGAPMAICRNPSDGLGSVTVSTSTATLSPHDDRRSQTHFRNCHPGYTPVVILTALDRVSDSDLVSGAHNQQWRNYRGYA